MGFYQCSNVYVDINKNFERINFIMWMTKKAKNFPTLVLI